MKRSNKYIQKGEEERMRRNERLKGQITRIYIPDIIQAFIPLMLSTSV
jgi:hypothetical protein